MSIDFQLRFQGNSMRKRIGLWTIGLCMGKNKPQSLHPPVHKNNLNGL